MVHAAELEPAGPVASATVSRASRQTDLANAQARNVRLAAEVHRLQRRLAEALGEQVWKESGLGSPTDIEALERSVTRLEQKNVELKRQLEEALDDLAAARAANRDLTRALNQRSS